MERMSSWLKDWGEGETAADDIGYDVVDMSEADQYMLACRSLRGWTTARCLLACCDRHYRLATSSHTYGAPRNIMANVRYRF